MLQDSSLCGAQVGHIHDQRSIATGGDFRKEGQMLTSATVYNGVNIILAATCLVALVLLFRFVRDKKTRWFLAVAFVLLILTSGIFSVSLSIFKLSSAAYTGEAVGQVEKGTFESVDRFKYYALVGNILELISIGLLTVACKRLLSVRVDVSAEEGAAQ